MVGNDKRNFASRLLRTEVEKPEGNRHKSGIHSAARDSFE